MSSMFTEAGFDAAARQIVSFLSRDQIERVADWIAGDSSAVVVLDEVTIPAYRQAISQVLGAASIGSTAERAAAAERLRAFGRTEHALYQRASKSELATSRPRRLRCDVRC